MIYAKNDLTMGTAIAIQHINFRPTPVINAANEPKAARKARVLSLLSNDNSPMRAPKKGPRMIPTGPRNRPTITPIVAPHAARFEPPNFLVNQMGNTLSNTVTTTTINAHITR